MKLRTTAALLVLVGLYQGPALCLAEEQAPLKERYRVACPAYEHYARSPQYVQRRALEA